MNPQLRRFALDFGPLLLFFAAYKLFNLYVATATVMAAATIALGIGYWIDRKIHPVPLTTVVLLAVFGGLTLYLKNDMFIKIKPTIIYALLGMLLAGGEIFNRSVAKYILGVAVSLDECWLARHHVAFRRVLFRDGASQRIDLAEFFHRRMGTLSYIRRYRLDLSVRNLSSAISPEASSRDGDHAPRLGIVARALADVTD